MQYGHRTLNTLPPLPLFATLNLTRVALTSSLHSYVSSCHSQTPNTLGGGDGHWLCPLFSNEITWAPMQMPHCWNCTVLSYLQTLGCSDRAQYHYQCREEAWGCCRGAVAVAVKGKWRRHGKLQETPAPPSPANQSGFLLFLTEFWIWASTW